MDLVPERLGDIRDHGKAADPGIDAQHIDPAQCVRDLGERRLGLDEAADVTADRQRIQLLGNRAQALLIASGHRQLGAFGPKQPRGSQADAGIPAQHQHAAVDEPPRYRHHGQNIPLLLAACSGTGWSTSQCSSTRQPLTRRISTTAEPLSPSFIQT